MDDFLTEEEKKILKAAEEILTSVLVRLEIKKLSRIVNQDGKVCSPGKLEMLASTLYEIEKAKEKKDDES